MEMATWIRQMTNDVRILKWLFDGLHGNDLFVLQKKTTIMTGA
jgi:hypothetical protein